MSKYEQNAKILPEHVLYNQRPLYLVWHQPQNPNKEKNRQEHLNQPMRVQIAGLPRTVIISLSE